MLSTVPGTWRVPVWALVTVITLTQRLPDLTQCVSDLIEPLVASDQDPW